MKVRTICKDCRIPLILPVKPSKGSPALCDGCASAAATMVSNLLAAK